MTAEVLLKIENLKKYFPVRKGMFSRSTEVIKAVDDVSLDVFKGETLGLVGESGCGKTTLGELILRLQRPTSGQVLLDGKNIYDCNRTEIQAVRRKMQVIFQDVFSSLNPRMTVGRIIRAPMIVHKIGTAVEQKAQVAELLKIVGMHPEYADRHPHEFSGGQRQRIGVARALALNPELIICDEPVSALDVSVQAQVLNLLMDLQQEYHLTYLFISHDLSVVRHISNRIAVMYLGRVVELAESEKLYLGARHPYTRALISASPVPNPKLERKKEVLKGEIPSPISPPDGCLFHTRCPEARELCTRVTPRLVELEPGWWGRCHNLEDGKR